MSIYITRQMIDPAHDTREREAGNGLIRRMARAATRNWRRRKMIAALDAMDDRTLRDIGLYRTEIPRVVEGFSDRELGMRPLARADERRAANEQGYMQAA